MNNYEHSAQRNEIERLSGGEVLLCGNTAFIRARWAATTGDEAWPNWRSSLLRTNVLVEDVDRNCESGACVGHVHNSGDSTLAWTAR